MLIGPRAFAEDAVVVSLPSGGVVVFAMQAQGESLKALSIESLIAMRRSFEDCGRLRPVEENQLTWALERARTAKPGDLIRKTAQVLNADAYCVIGLSQEIHTYIADLSIVPLKPEYETLRRTLRVKSRLPHNIPLKLAKAVTDAQSGIPVHAPVLRKTGEGSYVIGAGQWHGITPGRYRSPTHGEITITGTGRYESVARIGDPVEIAAEVEIRLFPDTEPLVHDLDRRISENTIRRYEIGNTLLRGDDAGKRYIEGMCIINPGGSVCAPIYGSFLATQYLGFNTPSPDMTGMWLGGAALFTQLMLPEFMTGFRGNFFPWNRDSDKPRSVQYMQTFLWASLPFTFSTVYLDQLAVAFPKTETLPPFFDNRDTMASLMSLFVPGGGHFYKGRRLPGWGFYFTEMAIASYATLELGNPARARYAFSLLAAVKLADIALAYLSRSSYRIYNMEVDRDDVRPSLSLQGRMFDREPVYDLALQLPF